VTTLIYAVKNNQTDIINYLASQGGNVNSIDIFFHDCLMCLWLIWEFSSPFCFIIWLFVMFVILWR